MDVRIGSTFDVRRVCVGCWSDAPLVLFGCPLNSACSFVGFSLDLHWMPDECSLDYNWILVGFALDLR